MKIALSHLSVSPWIRGARQALILAILVLNWLLIVPLTQAGTHRSCRYDGATAGMRFAHRPEFNASLAMTLEAWVYRENATRCETIIGNDYRSSFWLGFCPDKLRFYRSGRHFADADVSIRPQRWTHVAASYDGAVVRFFVDGAPAGVEALANEGLGEDGPVYLGRDAFDALGGFRFLGKLDEVRIWSEARSHAEIRADMWREVAPDEPGLAVVFPHGGRRGHSNREGVFYGDVASTLPELISEGMLPRELVVPYVGANSTVTVDGIINSAFEYPNAETLVLRYPGLSDGLPDALVRLVRDDDYLYMAVKGARPAMGRLLDVHSLLALHIDANYSGGSAPDVEDRQIAANVDPTSDLRYSWTGTGDDWRADFSKLSRDHFMVAKSTNASEFAAPDIEFRIHRELLGILGYSRWHHAGTAVCRGAQRYVSCAGRRF